MIGFLKVDLKYKKKNINVIFVNVHYTKKC